MHTNEKQPRGAHGTVKNNLREKAGFEHDPASEENLGERILDSPHPPSQFDSGNGQGTVSGPPLDGGVLDHPILDGATQSAAAEATVPNPYRGVDDPATIGKQPALNNTRSDRWLLAGVIATVVVAIPLVLLATAAPVWAGIGLAAALVGLLLMLAARWLRIDQKKRLRTMAVLLAWIWIVPAVIIVTILFGQADRIFPT